MRVFRNCLQYLLLAGAAIFVSPACADALAMKTFALLSKADLTWGEMNPVFVAGQPVYWRSFHSPKKLMVVAAGLSEFSGVFQRALLLPGKVLLSGVQEGRHWVAELTSSPQGVNGILSMLPLAPVSGASLADPTLAWMDTLAQQHLGHDTRSSSSSSSQRIYSTSLDVNRVKRVIADQLLARGWSVEGSDRAEGVNFWRKEAQSLVLFAHSAASGSTLFVHLASAKVQGRRSSHHAD